MAATQEPESSTGAGTVSVQWAGRLGGPALAIATGLLLPAGEGGLSDAGRWTAAIAVLLAVLWITEALPLPATSLLPIVLFPLAGVATLSQATTPYASDVIFLFMGGFILALGMEKWGLHRRIALRVLSASGTRPARVVGGFMVASGFLSMWISNTATTVMMLPIGASILRLVEQRTGAQDRSTAPTWGGFSAALMLGIAYAASIGSLGTLIGTPPNLLLRGFLQRTYGIELGFGSWMLAALPLSILLMFCTWLLLTRMLIPDRSLEIPGGRELIRSELAQMGSMSTGERIVGAVFVATALAWIVREPISSWLGPQLPWVTRVNDTGIALTAALLLFLLPVDVRHARFAMDWETAQKLPWGVLLLFGGGLSLAAAIQRNGVDGWLGQQLIAAGALPTWALVLVVVVCVIFLTELTSNTAVTATFLPVLGGVAAAVGAEPVSLLIPAAIAATCAFMMPVATPPNAIVFGSGYVSMRQMVTVGLWLNFIAIVLIALFTFTTARWILP